MADKHISDILKDLDKHHTLAINFAQEHNSFVELMRGTYIICSHTNNEYACNGTTINGAKIDKYNISLEEKHRCLRPNKISLQISRNDENKIIKLEGLVSGNNMCLRNYKIIEKNGFETTVLKQQDLHEKTKIIDKENFKKYVV